MVKERLIIVLRHPFAPLLPWGGVALGLLLTWIIVHQAGVADLQSKRQAMEADWVAMRQALVHHREARKAGRDLTHVWTLLPAERDFSPLALGISDEASRDRVTLPALSYKTEPTRVAHTTKGLLQGTMSGRYEDLRRFIHGLETAEELLFIEDLELNRAGHDLNAPLTFNIKIATYLRADSEKRNTQEAVH